MQNYKGIYGYWDKKKNKVAYIGKDSNMYEHKREEDHLAKSNINDQPFNKILQNNINRFEYFEIIKLPYSTSDDVLNDIEIIVIGRYGTYKNRRGYGEDYGYNFTKGGEGATGRVISEDTKNKISNSLKGENHPMYGKHISEDAKKRLSETRIGKLNPMYGKHHSEEVRAKMSEKRKKEKHPHWKDYPRIVKAGFKNSKQIYGLKYNGEYIMRSINKEKVEKKLNEILSGEYDFEKEQAKKNEPLRGKNHPLWKDYPRIIKAGIRNGKQFYAIKHNGKNIKASFSKEELEIILNKMLNDDNC